MKRIKRLIAFLLCLIVILSITTLNIPVLAASNPYPSSQTISGVTTVPCTRYAWQQVYDRLGIALQNWGNAINWLDNAANAGYSTGSVAKVNSIAVWRSSAHSYGHVSFVTAVNGNSMTINEGGMTINNKPANGTGIITGAKASSIVGTKKDSYSSCTLLGFIYLTKATSGDSSSGSSSVTTVTIKNTGVENITSSNAFLKSVINKPKSYAVQRVGVKIRREGKTYTEEWKFHKQDAAKAWTDYAEVELTWNLSSECGYSLIHATKYYYKMYAVIDGVEYWSEESSFTTAGSHSYSNACDTSCNTCGATRKVSHNFASATCELPKTCKVCGKISGSALGHTYTTSCDKSCNHCKATRSIKHTYSNACDTSCNVCKATRTITHAYKTTTTKATLSKNGKTVKKCTVCGKVASTTTIKYAKTFKLSATTYTYNGKVKTPIVTVKDSAGNKLKKNVDYTLSSSSGRKNVGTYKVTIKMKGKYSGTKTLTFKIVPVKTKVSKLTAGKKSITVNISKKSTQVTGYQVQYSTSKKFTNTTTKSISSYKTTKVALKSLRAKKTYYVRVRTYKTVNGKKYYSAWSTAKSVKTK